MALERYPYQSVGSELYPKIVQMQPNNINDVWIGGGDDYHVNKTIASPNAVVYAGTVNASCSGGEAWAPLVQSSQDPTVDDSTGNLIAIALANGGSGYTSPAFSVSISGGGGSGAAVEAFSNGTAVTSVQIVSVGTGYTKRPTFSFANGGGTAAMMSGTIALSGSQNLPNASIYSRFEGAGSDESTSTFCTVTFLASGSNGLNGNPILTFTTPGSLFESTDAGANWYDIQAYGPTSPSTNITGGFTFKTPNQGTNGADPFIKQYSKRWPRSGPLRVSTPVPAIPGLPRRRMRPPYGIFRLSIPPTFSPT